MRVYVFTGVLILLIVNFISASFGVASHAASEILVNVDGVDMSLQDAFDNGFLKDGGVASGFPPTSYDKSTREWHSGEDIQIYLNGVGRVKLQEAINDRRNGKSFCGGSLNSFSWLFSFGHSADEIIFEDDETLNEKVDNQGFCAYVWKYGSFGSCDASPYWGGACSPSCGPGSYTSCLGSSGNQYRDVWCERSDGVTVGDSLCSANSKPSPSTPCSVGCSGSNSCNNGVCPVNCEGYWNLDAGPCSRECDGGNYDKQWVTTVSPVGSGAACPSPLFVDNGGNSCNPHPWCSSRTIGWDVYTCAGGWTNQNSRNPTCNQPRMTRGGYAHPLAYWGDFSEAGYFCRYASGNRPSAWFSSATPGGPMAGKGAYEDNYGAWYSTYGGTRIDSITCNY